MYSTNICYRRLSRSESVSTLTFPMTALHSGQEPNTTSASHSPSSQSLIRCSSFKSTKSYICADLYVSQHAYYTMNNPITILSSLFECTLPIASSIRNPVLYALRCCHSIHVEEIVRHGLRNYYQRNPMTLCSSRFC